MQEKNTGIPSLWWNGATMPWLEEAPLLDGGSYGSMEDGGEGVWVAWETKGLKASTRGP